MDCHPPGSSSSQEFWSGFPFPTPGDLPNPGIEPTSPLSPALAGRFFTHCATWEASCMGFLLFSRLQLCATPWTTAHQASLSITNSRSLLKLMFTESVTPSNHLILCHPLLLPSIFPSTRVFSNESILCIRWPQYWRFSFSISPSIKYSGVLVSIR